MIRRNVVAMALAVMFVVPALAQSRGGKAAPDPVSGTWQGEILPSGAPRGRAVTLNLKHDGKGHVSGTVDGMPNPADVKTGSTFDPKTGALKLQLGRKDDPAVLLVLEGTVAKQTASGRVSGDVSGEFTLAKAGKPK